MARKKKHVSNLPEHWVISDTAEANGRKITKGTELSFKGIKGRFIFQRRVEVRGGGSWIDVIGGPEGHKMLRSFGLERVRTVHRIAKKRESQQ